MQLHLVHSRDDLHMDAEISEHMRIHIAYAYRADFLRPVQLFHCAPATVIVAHRLMNEVEVKIVQPQLFERKL